MCIPALVVCLAGAKTHQVSTSAVLTAFLRLSASCGGVYFPDATRDHPINGLYLIFSHKSRHIYFGETTTSNRVFQHWHAALGQPSQRVHYAMQRQGPSNFHCITVNLPDGIDRKALEVALIRKFDGFGKYLLNEKCRPTRRPDGKARATEIAVSRFFDPPPTQRFHQTHFHRPYRRVGYSPTLSIAPCRIPTVILYPNGFGGALEGLRLTGCYDVRLIVAFSLETAASLRSRFKIPVFVHDVLHCPLVHLTQKLETCWPRKRWTELLVQGTVLPETSCDGTVSSAAITLHHVLDVCALMAVRHFWFYTSSKVIPQIRSSHSYYTSTFQLHHYIPSGGDGTIISDVDLLTHAQVFSDSPIPAANVLPHLPDDTVFRSLAGAVISNIHSPAPSLHRAFSVHDPEHPPRALLVDEIKVLMGYGYNHDHEFYDNQARRWYAFDVPPPIALAFGRALVGIVLDNYGLKWDVRPPARDALPIAPTTYTVYPGDMLSHSLDTCMAASLGQSFSVITVVRGTHDTTTTDVLRRFRGRCGAFFNGSIRSVPLHRGLRALRLGHLPAIMVFSVRVVDPLSDSTMDLLHQIWKTKFRASSVPAAFRRLEYWDLHRLYRVCGDVPNQPELVAGARRNLTRLSNIFYNSHPNPRISFRIQGLYGLNRRSIHKLCFSFLRSLRIPDAAKQFVLNHMTVSFTKSRSIGELICNFRGFCDSWSPTAPWVCSCSYLQRLFGIIPGDDTQAPGGGSYHIHARFDQCHGVMHQRVLHSNMRDSLAPAVDDIHDMLRSALYPFLCDAKRFACSIRRTPDLSSLHMSTNPTIGITAAELPVAQMAIRLGFHYSRESSSLYDKVARSTTTAPGLTVDNDDTEAFMDATSLYPGRQAVVSYLDKNAGLGSLVCPHLYWHTLNDTFWTNPDYVRTDHNAATLTAVHYSAYTTHGWESIGRFHATAPPGNIPFIFGKFKSNRKYRTVLSAFKHPLKTVYARVALALRVVILALTADTSDPWNANLNAPFDARFIKTNTDEAIRRVRASNPGCATHIDAYGGDVAKMFDKLPCPIVITAVEYALSKSLSVSRRYNLRTATRQHITINLRDGCGHRIGRSYQGEGIITISFVMIMTVCRHYCFKTHFYFACVYFLLVLGVPQGGSLSDPMSKIFCMYCEYMWLSSLFDFSKISGHGEIRSCDMTPTGRATFSRHIGFALDPADDTVLSVAVFKRYADDCRLIMAYDPSVPSGAAVSAALISLYKTGCYKDPCTLDDEERGISFPFMQGFYVFSPECRVFYTVKNALPIITTRTRRIRALQHFRSYAQDPATLRFACLMGKLAEIDAVASDDESLTMAVALFSLEWHLLSFPIKLVRKALFKKAANTGDTKWVEIAAVVAVIFKYFEAHLPAPP